MYPHLVKMYSNDNILAPDKTLYTSSFYYKWHCDDCGGDFTSSIDKLDKEGCPYCNDIKVLTGKNDLKTMLPDIANHYSSNNEKLASEILYNNNSTYNWNCDHCGGEYKATIDDIKNGYCPYCENKKVLKGFNDLTTTHPQLVKEWGLENYLIDVGGPENYKFDSTKNVYWLCPNCKTHYRMNIDDRVINDKRHHEACWKCSGRMKNILKL